MSILFDKIVEEQLRSAPPESKTREQLLEQHRQNSMLSDKSRRSQSGASSTMSVESTASTARLIKNKLMPRSKSIAEKTPAQKQAEKKAARMSNELLATMWALK